MTSANTDPAAPDTRPRCGGSPGHPGVMPKGGDEGSTRWMCTGCADCDLPDTGWTQGRTQPISDGIVMVAFERGAERSWVDEGIVRAIRLEAAVALQEARERADVFMHESIRQWERSRAAEADAALAWEGYHANRARADAADAEVEGLRGALKTTVADWKREEDWREEIGYIPGHATNARRRVERALYPPAASRPLSETQPTCARCSGVCERCDGDGWEECGEGVFCADGGIHRCRHGCPERAPAASRPLPHDGSAFQYQDAMSALRYHAERYGRLDGVGWDRILPPPAIGPTEIGGGAR